MEVHRYDAIVVGSGPGGEGAAMRLAKSGRRVAIVERYAQVGGGCTHWGTIPSKALRAAVQRLAALRDLPQRRVRGAPRVTYEDMMSLASRVIEEQVALRRSFYERNEVTVVEGHAAFVDPHTLDVEGPTGNHTRYRADHIVLAVGSRPWHPADVDFTHPRICDADTVLQLSAMPRNVIVYGAGVIGCEYTSIFRRMGVKVQLINTRDRLLAFLDDEITDALAYHLRDQGVLIRHQETAARIEPGDDGVTLHTESGKHIHGDVLLFALGRQGNTGGLNLEAAGVEYEASYGRITINSHYQSSVPHIYAVGDVVGYPSLASAAYDQGRFAATHIIDPSTDDRLVRDIPTGIYTSPEISSVGRTERELTKAKVPYEVGRAQFRHLARAQILGETVGSLKILFHSDTLEILGIHCFGHNAAEIIHIGQAVMAREGEDNSLLYFVNTTFNYPTMAEAYRVAALNGLNRLH